MDAFCIICRCLEPGENLLLTPTDKTPSSMVILERDAHEIEKSGASGCIFCCAILEIGLFFNPQIMSTRVTIRIREGIIDLFYDSQKIQLYTPLGFPQAWQNVPVLPELGCGPISKQAFEFTKKCLNSCLLQHKGCIQLNPALPTRLLDVTASNRGIIRLIESNPHSSGRYVALSYCWGEEQQFKTTTDTLESHRSGFPISKLPKSLQDAIYLTKALDCNYLWVDALCIIQDDENDWDLESSRMASVYENAFVTIAASSALTVHKGFLQNVNPTRRTTFRLAWSDNDGRSSFIHARHGLAHDWQDIGSSEPLQTRAWALQEHVLSTRVLTFGDEELRWSCKTRHVCQCGMYDIEEENLQQMRLLHTKEEASSSWRSIVQRYCRRDLSFPLDKLPALSGLAKVFHNIIDSEYLAGLWKCNLIEDLTWYRGGPRDNGRSQPSPATLEYIAPTFSWASVQDSQDGIFFPTLVWPKDEEEMQNVWTAEIISSHTSLFGQNPFGRVTGGSIQLRGHLIPAVFSYGPNLENVYSNSQFSNPHWLNFLGVERMFQADTRLMEHTILNDNGQRELSLCRSSQDSLSESFTPNILIQLFYLGYSRWSEEEGRGCQYLLVLGISPDNSKFYERLGLLQVIYEKLIEGRKSFQDSFLSTITIV